MSDIFGFPHFIFEMDHFFSMNVTLDNIELIKGKVAKSKFSRFMVTDKLRFQGVVLGQITYISKVLSRVVNRNIVGFITMKDDRTFMGALADAIKAHNNPAAYTAFSQAMAIAITREYGDIEPYVPLILSKPSLDEIKLEDIHSDGFTLPCFLLPEINRGCGAICLIGKN
jgi:hypothetical protein